MEKRKYILAQIGPKKFVILTKTISQSYWTKYGTKEFASEIEARGHAVICEVIL